MLSSIILDWNLPLTWLAPLFALGAIFTGFFSILVPRIAIRFYGLPDSEEGRKFFPVIGARNLALGLAALGLLVYGWRQPLGILLLACAAPGLVDSVVVYRRGTRGAFYVHAAGTVILLTYAAWLMGAF